MATQTLDHTVVDALNSYKKDGKRIVLISDFYLPKRYFQKLLQYHHLTSLFDEIIVSSDYHLKKSSGRLYEKALSVLKIKKEEVVMLGDNPHSDYKIAADIGIKSFLISRTNQQLFYQADFNQSVKLKYLKRTSLIEVFPQSPQRLFEPLLGSFYIFIAKLYYSLRQKKAKDVFFLSREGEYLKELFEIYQNAFFPTNKINVHYLLVSRKATFMASLKPLAEEKFDRLFRQYRTFSIASFLKTLNFNDQESQTVFAALQSIDCSQLVADFPVSLHLKLLTELPLFRVSYEKKRTEQKQCFFAYLKQFNVDFTVQALHLVDVGWKGSIQDNIRHIVADTTVIWGHYLGLVAAPMLTANNHKEGLLFSCLNHKIPDNGIWGENKTLFEVILGASHGSADHYQKRGEQVSVALASEPEEVQIFLQFVQPLQQVLLTKYRKLVTSLSISSLSFTEFYAYFLKLHSDLVFFPNQAERRWFQSIKHFENFGLFSFSEFSAGKFTWSDRLQNTWALLISPRKTLVQFFWPALTFDYVVVPGGRYIYKLLRRIHFIFSKE